VHASTGDPFLFAQYMPATTSYSLDREVPLGISCNHLFDHGVNICQLDGYLHDNGRGLANVW
jgi:hypothetical protein